MTWIFFVALGWAICAALAYGIDHANWVAIYPPTTEREARDSQAHAMGLAIFGGPISLFIVFFITGFAQDGLLFRRVKPAETRDSQSTRNADERRRGGEQFFAHEKDGSSEAAE